MFNMIRMECYRMFRTKALYVTWIIMAAVIILTTVVIKVEFEDSNMQQQNYEQYEKEEQMGQNGEVTTGMNVVLPTKPGEKVTLYDIFYGNAQGRALALFVIIFTILYATADFNSGYIKNIGGQVKNRAGLVAAKVVCVCLYTVCTVGLFLAIQAIANRVILGYFEWGAVDMLLKYLLIVTVLHIALAVICMAFAIIIRNNVVSIVLAVCMCFNLFAILYSAIDKVIEKIGIEDFRLVEYTVTGKISMLRMDLAAKDCLSAGIVAAVFFVAAAVIAGIVFRKKDI